MDFHTRVRELTRPHHDTIETSPLFSKIMSGHISLNEYHRLIQKFLGYIHPCELKIQNSPWASLLNDRCKSPQLVEDLGNLNLSHDVSHCELLPEFNSYASILGYLYVIEGSTLGGQIITKALGRLHGLMPEKGISFFSGYGKETKSKWIEFCSMLNQVTLDQESLVIHSACETFTTLHHWIMKD